MRFEFLQTLIGTLSVTLLEDANGSSHSDLKLAHGHFGIVVSMWLVAASLPSLVHVFGSMTQGKPSKLKGVKIIVAS